MTKNFGFLKMNKEINEKRAFLPDFFEELKECDVNIWLESGYGSKLGFTEEDYLEKNNEIKFSSRKDIFSKDVVIVLRTPEEYELNNMKKGSVLISMLHYHTRERRNKFIKKLGISAFSMDSMVDDHGKRVVVNSYGTAFNGANIALNELEKKNVQMKVNNDKPINVSVIGVGDIGLAVAKAFKNLSNERMKSISNYNGLKITMFTRSITSNENILKNELRSTDILVDASSRDDTSKSIISNVMINELSEYAVILDITADPYDFDIESFQVKAIEGIPTGDLDQTVFEIDDKAYEKISEIASTKFRRVVVSCNAWPGVDPIVSKKLYALQLLPILKVLIQKGHDNIDENSKDYYERILYKSSYECFENSIVN
ncbi:Rossmann-fold NAD(P)-binding domain-containing protein [Helicovermis profundi]|uniref:Alanine dehydrogenase/pyridine nucleotide transhydrogenase N-terminal domain-containing protein n=1 Tax=Helicovermis profundi TaxID=3065157 RepID=A0AAU9EKM6_9FIRM|nr:hypothetical protein HLPR_24840 [Clostridia bacterium S502]